MYCMLPLKFLLHEVQRIQRSKNGWNEIYPDTSHKEYLIVLKPVCLMCNCNETKIIVFQSLSK